MVKDLKPPLLACKSVYKGAEMKEFIKKRRTRMIFCSQGINRAKSKVTTGGPEQ